ncbi:hypothetical protein OKA04_07760 [Luteolibacter flavescens]|uniref:DUF4034 domain-containing protein n=1 Tax=Luteolibacter flavescens TaxID=1859460 RepID=A0ABT3FM25_9BACT|nr:hypothetical protein [Luteolibacter flavescens]MCW1884625.1 hypothetical protein [Luteolibacter flavescens]
MPRAKTILSACLLVAVIGGLSWSCREAGKRMARAGWFHGGAGARDASPPVPVRGASTVNVVDRRPDAAANALLRLTHLCEGSIYLASDWETQAEVKSILEGLSAEELAEIFRMMEEDFTHSPLGKSFLLGRLLMEEWVRKDPAAALVAAFRHPRLGPAEAFTSWSMADAASALAWLESESFPAELAKKKDELREAALRPLLGRDFALASAEFLKLPPGGTEWQGRAGLMRGWAADVVHDPALREQLVAFAKTTGHPGDHSRMNDSLLRAWPQEDALGMLTYLNELRDYMETADVPADQRPGFDAMAVGAAIYREYDRPALEWWMERHADQPEVPGALQDAMIQWRAKYPDKVAQWMAEQPPSLQRDAMQASFIPSLATSGKMEEAAQIIQDIADPGLRQSAIERLDYMWSRYDATAAEEWRAGLSENTDGQ